MKQATTLFLFCFVLLASCNTSGTDRAQKKESDSLKSLPSVPQSDTSRIITLPTPMQIPALLRNMRAHYQKDILLPIENAERPFFKSSVLFGMYMSDLAYASAFSDHQAARAYFKKCWELGDGMGLGGKMDKRLVRRFENNLGKPDSLGRIILEMYDHGHYYLQSQDKAGIGLLMIMGCYFEGLHMTFTQAREHDLILFAHILNQQKQYADNLLYALRSYEIPAEVQTEYEMLNQVGELFESMNPPTVYDLKTGNASISDLDSKTLDQLQNIVLQFRQSVLI